VKKRLRQYPKFNNPVSSLAFNCDGTKLAVAVSYTWDEGEAGLKTAERPMVAVRRLGDEVKVSFSRFSFLRKMLMGWVVCSRRDGRGLDLLLFGA
jgi:hypothetical protein